MNTGLNKLADLKNLQDLSAIARNKAATKEILTVSTDVVISKVQSRKKFDLEKIKQLAKTILKDGQQSPIIVSPKNADGLYVIEKGERRWRACKLAGITIDITINNRNETKLDKKAGELIENLQRESLDPLEIADGLSDFVKEGWKQQDIAERIGKSLSFVSTHLSLLNLPDCVKELSDKDICADTETLNNLRILHGLSPERCAAVCELALTSGIGRKQSRDILDDTKLVIEKNKSKKQNIRKEKLKGGDDNVILDEIKTENIVMNNWKDVEASSLKIKVVILNDKGEKTNQSGLLMTNRVSFLPNMVWVELSKGKKKQSIEVSTANINIISVEA